MKYLVFAEDGKEYGPVDAETLRKWVESGRVLPETRVRNVMVKRWNKAGDLDFLKEAFQRQQIKVEESKTAFEHGLDFLKSVFGGTKQKSKSTAFRYTFLPNPASVSIRLAAFLFDFIIIAFFAFILSLVFTFMSKKGFDVNLSFSFVIITFYLGILLYYSVSLGLFAQTFGMWFWGIMIVSSDIDEVYLGRAYFFTICMLLFGIISPLIVYLNPEKRSLHEYLSGTRIIGIAAKPKV
ncbi:MAG TPA: RDD family protein [Victivallales bacterium]|nr:RDD family protein [Victivallales bacterium]HRR28167.1 RDD family protein [Victivallales bacterium]